MLSAYGTCLGRVSDAPRPPLEGSLRAERLLLLGEPALLDDGVVHLQLLLRALDNLLLDRVLGDEAEDLDLLLLPDPVRAVHRLTRRCENASPTN